MFKDLSVGWPGEAYIPPYIRPADERSQDFELVNQGYLGYQSIGYSVRDCELFVWLEVLRDKQCDDKPCELGVLVHGKPEPKGGCPVKIHIPEMLDLLGNGRHREALELIESCNPLPNVTGRVCPQELQCQGVCTHTKRPIEIGQIEWYLPAARQAGEPRRQQALRRPRQPVGRGDEAADRGGRLRPVRADQRVPARGRRLPGHDLRGVPRPRRRAALRHSRNSGCRTS